MKTHKGLSLMFEKDTSLQILVFAVILFMSTTIFPQHKKPHSPHKTVEKKTSGGLQFYITFGEAF